MPLAPNSPLDPGPVEGPKSRCTCGHTGDGPFSQHEKRFAEGHGACRVRRCYCKQFTWRAWLKGEERRQSLRADET